MCGWEASRFVTPAKPNKDNVRNALVVCEAVVETQKTVRGKPSSELTGIPHCPPRPGDLVGIHGRAGQRVPPDGRTRTTPLCPNVEQPHRRCLLLNPTRPPAITWLEQGIPVKQSVY